MPRTSFPVEPNAIILLQIHGDLELAGVADVKHVTSDHTVNIYRNDQGQIVIEAQGDAELRVPARASIIDAHVDGDVDVQGILGGVEFREITGDAKLVNCGAVNIRVARGDLELERISAGVKLDRVDGDLELDRVRGGGSCNFIAGDLDANQCAGTFEFKSVAGDVEINRLDGHTEIDSAAGDVSARAVSGVLGVQNVGGDLDVDGAGSVVSQGVGGDAVLRNVRDDVTCSAVGGDFSCGGAVLLGSLSLNVGGDASLGLSPQAGDQVTINAGGDVHCNLGPDASAEINIVSGEGRETLYVGDGAASVRINAGGGVRLTGAENADVRREVKMDGRLKMGKFKVKLPQFLVPDPPTPPMPEFRWAEPASQPAPPAPAAAGPRADSPVIQINPTPVSDEERKIILRMLAEKKITVEQADQLLSALE